MQLFGRLVAHLSRWSTKLDDSELQDAAVDIGINYGTPRQVRRVLIEKIRDRLDRAQERSQFSSDEDQQDLADVIADLDRLLKTLPAN